MVKQLIPPTAIRPNATQRHNGRLGMFVLCLVMIVSVGNMTGCEVDSFFNPSSTGRYERYPTTIPVLDRLDLIEQEADYFADAAPPTSDDLVPRDLAYYLYPGDVVTVGIYELYQQSQWNSVTRRIDAGGYFRVPELGEVRAAGLTAQQLEEELTRLLKEKVIVSPQVDVVVEQGGGLRYTIFGYLQTPGVFNLQSPDFRLLDALAIAGGVPLTTEKVYVIRQVILSEDVKPTYDRDQGGSATPTTKPDSKPVDINELIDQLDKDKPQPRVSPGMLPQATRPLVDIDQLEPARTPKTPPPVDVDTVRPPSRPTDDGSGDSFLYVEERGEWVRVPGGAAKRPAIKGQKPPITPVGEPEMILERIIRIDYQKLSHGDSSQNIVVRPNDRIYIDGPPQGFVYIDGEANRAGVYNLPPIGVLTLSRLIAASGGLNPVAIPERVDLTRRVGFNREATIRLDLAAIRQRTEPDVVLKPDDHIIIGTNWIAIPLAILRGGFRATYGFGFILDRNFATDVFGAEQTNFN